MNDAIFIYGFEVTELQAYITFQKINARVFEGKLQEPVWDIDDLDTELGYCIKEDYWYVIGLITAYPSRQVYEDTMCHEMAHLYQYQILKIKPNHGKTFKEIAVKAAAKGYNIL